MCFTRRTPKRVIPSIGRVGTGRTTRYWSRRWTSSEFRNKRLETQLPTISASHGVHAAVVGDRALRQVQIPRHLLYRGED
jgi:hypothetical protein